ncbi:MAG: hypothetical protein QM674_14640 [Burkholderiaceae bacterium]
MLLTAVALPGCSAMISTSELEPNADTIDGVPFRVRERFVVEVYQKTDKGYTSVGSDIRSLPNPNRVYLLRHKGQAFADSDSKLTLRDDGTLTTVDLNATPKAGDVASTIGDSVQSLAKQVGDLRTARATAATAKETATQAGEQSDLDYLDAYNAALVSDQQLSELGADENASVVLAKRNEVHAAKLKANVMARRAGLPRPFPDISF